MSLKMSNSGARHSRRPADEMGGVQPTPPGQDEMGGVQPTPPGQDEMGGVQPTR